MQNIDFGGEAQEPQPASLTLPDVAAAKASLEIYKGAIIKMQGQLKDLDIVDTASLTEVASMGIAAKKLSTKIKATVKQAIDEPNERIKQIRALGKMFTEPLAQIVMGAKQKEKDYQSRLLLAEREAEKKAQKAREKAQAELDKQAKKMQVEPVKLAEIVTPKAPRKTQTEHGISSKVAKWACTIIDKKKVPKEYMVVSQQLLNDAVKRGVREIPGCEIKEDFDIRYR